MNNTLKRLLSLALAVVMVMSYGVMPVAAEEGADAPAQQCTHVWADGACTVEGCDAVCDHTGAVVTETAPTCTGPGVKISTCSTCGNVSTETIPATGEHVYDDTTGLCNCGAANPSLPAEVDDEDEETHTCDFAEVVSDTATCSTAGMKTTKCTCGETQEVESPAKGHAFGDGTVTTEPTCANAGVLTKTCGCGETSTEVISATGEHNYVDGVCTGCTAADPNYVSPDAGHTHEWNQGEVTLEALCTDTGVMTYTCLTEGCGETRTETIPAQCTDEVHAWECPFNLENPANRCTLTEGCALVKDHPGDCTGMDTFDTPEAKLRAAIDAIETVGTVTLESDVTLTSTLTIPAGKTVTLDLAGHTISQEKACTESYSMIKNEGTLTITGNGKLSFNDTGNGDPSFGWGSYTIHNTGTLTVENGTIEHLGQQNTSSSVKHMYCAIFQYSGSTTIKGGTISTPTYRSVRLWGGSMTIDGGTFEGQLWVQAVDNTAKLTINKGTFGPRGADGSSVFVTNGTYTVDVSITGGNFTTRIGVGNTANLSGFITGGKFPTDGSLKKELIKLGYKQDTDGTIVEDTVKAEVEAPKAEIATTVTISEPDKVSITESTVNNSETVTKTITAAVDSSVVDSMVKTMDTAGATDAIVTMQIKLTGTDTAEDSASASASIEKLTYDIHPIVQTVQITNKGESTEKTKVIDTEKVENEDIKAPITFRIPIPASVTAVYAYLTHEGNPMGLYEIKTENDQQQYIECSSDNFSEFTVEPASDVTADTTMVAQIGTAKFATLEKAIEDAANDNTIVLQTNVTTSTLTIPTSKTVTIDINGKNLSNSTGGHIFDVSGNLTLKDSGNGKVSGNTDIVRMRTNGVLIIESGVYEAAECVAYGSGDANGYTINIEDGTLSNTTAAAAVIQTNGSTSNVTVNVFGGSITSKDIGIYFPSQGNLNISGGSITGLTGVYVKSGNIEISSGTIMGTANTADYTHNPNGANATGDAVVIENVGSGTGYESVDIVSISGGNFASTYASPVASYAPAGSTAKEKFVSGGTFSGAVKMSDDVVVASKRVPANTSGTYTLENTPSSTDANGNVSYYEDLDDMLSKNVANITLNANETLAEDHNLTTEVNINVGTYGIYGNKTLTTDKALVVNDMGTKDTDILMPVGGTAKLNAAGSSVFTPGDCTFDYSKISVNGKDYFNEDAGANVTVAADGSVTFNGDFISVSYDAKGNIVYTMRKVEDKESKSNVFYYGSDSRMLFVSDGFSYLLSSVYVDDKPVAESNYIVEDGSTHVTLRNSFLKTLTKGTHTLTMKYEDGGYATCNFYVKTQSVADETNPKTGDFILMPMAIMTLSATALAVLLISKKKRV